MGITKKERARRRCHGQGLRLSSKKRYRVGKRIYSCDGPLKGRTYTPRKAKKARKVKKARAVWGSYYSPRYRTCMKLGKLMEYREGAEFGGKKNFKSWKEVPGGECAVCSAAYIEKNTGADCKSRTDYLHGQFAKYNINKTAAIS